jgi:lysophospholipase L1-like esterase
MTRTILCYGDSNTHGTGPIPAWGQGFRLDRADRWPSVMASALGTGYEVIAEGHGGRTVCHDDPVEGPHRNGMTILPAILESHKPLDLVIVKLGTNDLKPRFAMNAADIALSLERMVRLIRQSECGPNNGAPQILLVAPPKVQEVGPLAEIFEGSAARSQGLGAAIRVVAERNGLGFVDAGDHIAVSPVDGIHYDAKAHHILGAVLAKAVQRHFG